MTWLSIDGGNEAKADRACYVAEWVDAECAYQRNLPPCSLLCVFACTLAAARARRPLIESDAVDCVIVERTQADGRLARGKTTPGTMVGLAWNTAAIAYTLARGAPVHEYTISAGGDAAATDWIGGINKAALHQRIWAALAPAERVIVAAFGRWSNGSRKRGKPGTGRPVDVSAALAQNAKRQAIGKDLLKHDWYNVLDAVGVGLFHLGRVGKGAAPMRSPRVALP